MKRKIAAISPLGLLTLAACGGSSSSSNFSEQTIKILKGPLQNANVFLDYDQDGILDAGETTGSTDASGVVKLTPTSETYDIVATTDNTTLDTYSGRTVSSITLTAPKGAEVVTPLTTLLSDGINVATASSNVATALGITLPDGETLLTYDPFATGSAISDADKLAYEKATTQVVNVLERLVELAPTADGVLDAAATAIYDHLAAQGGVVDLSSSAAGSALAEIGTNFQTAIGDAVVTTAALNAKMADLATVNSAVKNATSATDLQSASNILELKTSGVEISDMLENLVAGSDVGTLTALGSYTLDASTFKILTGDHSDKFEISDSGVLKVATGATFAAEAGNTSEVELKIQVTDTSGKVHVSTISLDVLDVSAHSELKSGDAVVTQFLETIAGGTEIGTLSPIGSNTADTTTYEILPGQASNKFEISNGVIKVADGATFEAQTDGTITLNIKVADQSGEFHVTQLSLNVVDVFEGAAVKGPLENALVFIDLNGNLVWDEGVDSDQVATASDGAFSVSVADIPDGVTPNIVVVSTSATVDTSSGLIVSENFKLTAPGDASKSADLAVTPVTTLLTSGDLTEADVAAALGLEGVDNLLQYNPYEDTNAARALKVEQTSHQVMNVLSTLQAAGETAGLTAEASLENSLKAFTAVIKVADAANPINLTDDAADNLVGLDALADSFVALVEADNSADAGKVANLKTVTADVLNGVKIVNERVGAAELVDGKLPTDLSEFVSTTNKLVADVATAVDLGNTDDFYIKDASDALNVAKNKSATAITLTAPSSAVSGITFDGSNISIQENIASGSVVAMVSSDDTGALTYKVTSADPTIAKYFEIVEDQDGVKLVIADGAQIDFETNPSMKVTVSVQDSYGKGFLQDFTFAVTNVDEDPTIAESAVSVAQGADLSQKLTITDPEGGQVTAVLSTDSDLFALSGNVLSTKRAVTQDDVEAGDVTLSIALTDELSGNTVFDSVTVSVTNVNDAPTFSTNSILGGTEGKAYSQKLIVADADGDVVTLTLVNPPSWLTITEGVLSGTVPSDDTKIATADTVTVKATDGQGGETLKDYLLDYTNVNDAPEFALDTDIEAYVAETADSTGIDAVKDTDKLSGTIVFNDSDPGDTLEKLTVSLDGAGDPRSDGNIALAGSYGELVFNPTDFSYVYTPDVDKIEKLHNQTVEDDFKFKVFDDEGMSDSLTLSVNISGANDNPRLALASEQTFITLGNNQTGTVIGDVSVYDGSQYAGFTLADSGSSNDNDKFERSSTGQLKLKSNVTTSYATQKEYFVEVYAQDYDENGAAVDGTKSSASATFTVSVSAADPAPQVVSVETDYSDEPLGIGEFLNFEVTLSEAAKSGGSTTMTLSNGARVTLSVDSSNAQLLKGQYEIQDGDTDTSVASPLEVNSIVAGTVTDVSDQGLTEQSAFDELGGIIVDANAPNAKLLGTEEDPHTYNPSTGILTLKGSSLGTIVSGTSRDVVDIVDWTKVSWNIDGLGSTLLGLDASYVASALVNTDGTTITVQLNATGTAELHALVDFGGVEASGGTPDALNVAGGFLQDLAGNASTEASTAASNVYITDQTPPALSAIEVNGAFTSTAVSGRVAGDTFIVGDTLSFTATVAEGSDLASLSNMQVTLTLSNNKQLNLVRADGADGTVKTFSADYLLSADDGDVASLTLKSYSLLNIKDIAGNVADGTVALADITVSYTGVAQQDSIVIDATAPTAKLLGTNEVPHTYDAATGVLSLQGEGLKTIQLAADNTTVTTIVDWTKLTWNVDGEGSTTHQFSASDISTAVINSAGTVLTVTLSSAGQSNLHSLDGFGGAAATSGTRDALQVAAGFLKDKAGNLSTETSTAVSEVTLSDETALVLNEVSFDGTPATRTGEGDNIGFKAIFTDPALSAGTELADDAQLVLTLNNGVSVTLGKSQVTGEELNLVGTYKVSAQDDTLDADGEIALDIVSIDATGVLDVAGNLADATDALTKKDLGSTDIIVDTIAPALDQVLYNSTSNDLVLVFKELLSTESIASNIAIMESFPETASVTSAGTSNTTITASLSAGETFAQGDTIEVDDDPFSFVDLAGNIEEIYLMEIGAVIT